MTKGTRGLPPGAVAQRSGLYENTSTHKEVTVTKGEPLPPTPARGQKYDLVEPTKHKSGR